MRTQTKHIDTGTDELLVPSPETQAIAKFIAMVVRDEMEDFHCAHLSDTEMAELNPLIRNAICTALHALKLSKNAIPAQRYVNDTVRAIPDYWEEPRLTEDFLIFVALSE